MKPSTRVWFWLAPLLLVVPPAQADKARRRDAVVQVVEQASPAVVHIATEQLVGRARPADPFEQLFGDLMGERQAPQKAESLGSGVIIDPRGTIVTNEHVIRGATAIHVQLPDGRQLEAEVLGADQNNDLAVLRVRSKEALPAIRLGTSSDLMIGETVVAIGSPYGLSRTVTVGVVSALGRSFRAEDRVYNDFVQTDASINPGNSGGPLLNTDGELIGINTAIFASAQGIGFAIPVDKVKRIVRELEQFGKIRPAWVGIQAVYLTPEVARQLGWDRTYGALVLGTDPQSPAARAKLQRGDIVAEIEGTRVLDDEDLEVRLRGYPAKTAIDMTVFRTGQLVKVTVTPEEFRAELAEALAWERLGIKVAPSRGALVIAELRRDSQAGRIGLRPGDILLRLNNRPVASREAFRDAIADARGSRSVLLLIQRGRLAYHLSLTF